MIVAFMALVDCLDFERRFGTDINDSNVDPTYIRSKLHHY